MTRYQLEHIIRACAQIADDDDLVIIGSQSILGQFPRAPAALRVSMEADVYPRNHPDRWELIDGTIGELSPFHELYGYYAQGVERATARLPAGWEGRLIPIQNENTRGATGWCLEIADLLVSKAVAGREKDHRFLTDAFAAGLATAADVLARAAETDLEPVLRSAVEARIRNADGGASR